MFMSRLVPWLGCALATFAELLSEGIRFVLTIACSRAALGAEVLFLRKQLVYYQEHKIRPRQLTDAARLTLLLWSAFSIGKSHSPS